MGIKQEGRKDLRAYAMVPTTGLSAAPGGHEVWAIGQAQAAVERLKISFEDMRGLTVDEAEELQDRINQDLLERGEFNFSSRRQQLAQLVVPRL